MRANPAATSPMRGAGVARRPRRARVRPRAGTPSHSSGARMLNWRSLMNARRLRPVKGAGRVIRAVGVIHGCHRGASA
jgi:hypothetical protein